MDYMKSAPGRGDVPPSITEIGREDPKFFHR